MIWGHGVGNQLYPNELTVNSIAEAKTFWLDSYPWVDQMKSVFDVYMKTDYNSGQVGNKMFLIIILK